MLSEKDLYYSVETAELVMSSYSCVEMFEKQIQKLSFSISYCALQREAEHASVLHKIPETSWSIAFRTREGFAKQKTRSSKLRLENS